MGGTPFDDFCAEVRHHPLLTALVVALVVAVVARLGRPKRRTASAR